MLKFAKRPLRRIFSYVVAHPKAIMLRLHGSAFVIGTPTKIYTHSIVTTTSPVKIYFRV